jgi:hypothetical protein
MFPLQIEHDINYLHKILIHLKNIYKLIYFYFLQLKYVKLIKILSKFYEPTPAILGYNDGSQQKKILERLKEGEREQR